LESELNKHNEIETKVDLYAKKLLKKND